MRKKQFKRLLAYQEQIEKCEKGCAEEIERDKDVCR
jgi:hypothetical protein